MGNNAAFTSFESSVLACYNKGVLDKALLSALMEPYRGMDIDSGGMVGTLSKKDRLDVIEITIKTFGFEIPVEPKLPRDYKTWSDDQCRMNDVWQESKWAIFNKITSKFDWC